MAWRVPAVRRRSRAIIPASLCPWMRCCCGIARLPVAAAPLPNHAGRHGAAERRAARRSGGTCAGRCVPMVAPRCRPAGGRRARTLAGSCASARRGTGSGAVSVPSSRSVPPHHDSRVTGVPPGTHAPAIPIVPGDLTCRSRHARTGPAAAARPGEPPGAVGARRRNAWHPGSAWAPGAGATRLRRCGMMVGIDARPDRATA